MAKAGTTKMNSEPVESVEGFLAKVFGGIGHWFNPSVFKPWFRGQSDSNKPPTPSILRSDLGGKREFNLATNFRLKAQAYSQTPETARLDQWLILMQHHGVLTRLLDWTESPLAGLFFAVSKFIDKPESKIDSEPGVWVLNPFELNRFSFPEISKNGAFPNTWTPPADENFKIAFGTAVKPTLYPFAFLPSFIHPRVASQKSCFTIHGTDKSDFEVIGESTELIKQKYFLKYHIPKKSIKPIIHNLFFRGVTFTSLFPDLDNLAKDLKYQFSVPEA